MMRLSELSPGEGVVDGMANGDLGGLVGRAQLGHSNRRLCTWLRPGWWSCSRQPLTRICLNQGVEPAAGSRRLARRA